MSPSQAKKINDHLLQHLKTLDCRQCGGSNLELQRILNADFLSVGNVAGKMVSRVCKTCGHVTLFDVGVMR